MKQSLMLLVFTIVAYSLSGAQDESCSAVMSTSANSITFLEEQKETRQSSCISSVITHLGRVHDVDAVHVLASYLDFVDPATSPRSGGFADVRPEYPAVGALFQIGKAATRELLSDIEGSGSPKVRLNAAKAYQAIYRDDLASGIRLIRSEELAANSTNAQSSLRRVLRMLIEDCTQRSEQESQACRDAARRD
jgi:hypothetical protein